MWFLRPVIGIPAVLDNVPRLSSLEVQRLRISPPGGNTSNWEDVGNTDNGLGDPSFADGSASPTVLRFCGSGMKR